MSAERKPVEATIIDERIAVTYPRLNVPAYTAIVTYQAQDPVPRTLFIPLGEVAPGREADLRGEIDKRSGTLYKRYLEVRATRIREDLERAGAFRPEVLRF